MYWWSYNNWSSLFNRIGSIVFESLEVFVEHLSNFLKSSVVLIFVSPSNRWVKNLWIDSVKSFGIAKVENWEGFEFSLSKWAIMDCVDDVSGSFDANTLNKWMNTFPIPYFPPVHPVLTSQTLTPCSWIFLKRRSA